MSFEPRGIVLQPGQGKELRLPGHPVIVPKLLAADTGGAYSLLEMTIRGGGPPLHIHRGEEEAFYVLDGAVKVRLGDQVVDAATGSLVLVPRGLPHTFWSPGEAPARMLVIFSPGGYEDFFREAAMVDGEPGSPEYLTELDRLRAKHNARLVDGE